LPRGPVAGVKRGPYKRKSMADRFWAKVQKAGDNECWLWTAALWKHGYGVLGKPGKHGGLIAAHRYSYELAYGSIPSGLAVCHACDTPACVNPNHLFAASQIENIRDMHAKGRAQRGETNGHAKLDAAAVKSIRESSETNTQLAAKFNVHPATVRDARVGSTWRHLA
jgi:hypothetical protein